MEPKKIPGHEILFHWLMSGCRIACKDSYRLLRIADLRSRVSDVQRLYGVRVERERVKGKNYFEYYFKPMPKI